jgi:WD40 repeat protein
LLTLYDCETGESRWMRAWPVDATACYPEFSPDGRTIVVFSGKPGIVRFLEASTGDEISTSNLSRPHGNVVDSKTHQLTTGRRFLVHQESVTDVEVRESAWVRKILEILGRPRGGDKNWDGLGVREVATARDLGSLVNYQVKDAKVSEDGSTLVTVHADHVAVWDLPLRPPLRLVMAVIAGLVGMAALVMKWRRLKARRAP